ncbi:hypothetical protein [Streptomyces iakyrus]|uniref:Uncharacterized protein n=1 Tax=Streptomyces iakyrus TaxID=68219 RepID=A0ABW8FCK4_9ACTN
MLSTPPALISVIGPVEPPLLAAWIGHNALTVTPEALDDFFDRFDIRPRTRK